MARLPGINDPLRALAFAGRISRDPAGAVEALHERYGPVAQVGGGLPKPQVVVLFGRDANEFVLARGMHHFRWHEAYQGLVPVDGHTALVVTDGDEHRRRRRLVQPAFHKRTIDGYIDVMVDEADAVIGSWQAGATVDGFAEMRRSIRRTVIRTLFGEHLRDRADEIGDLLQPALDFVNKSPFHQIRIDLPWTSYHRALQARAAVDELIDAEIGRRKNGAEGHDILQSLLDATDEDGDSLSPAELRDQVASLIAAGYETTSASVGWALARLGADPALRAALRAELDTVIGDRQLQVDDLPALPVLDGIVHETLRLHPAAPVAARYSADEFEFGGHTIPAGIIVLYSTTVTHQDPDLWPDPLAFRPERWNPQHPDYVEPQPYSFVTFGGGTRRCLGFAYATLEMKVLLSRLLQQVEIESVEAGLPEPTGMASVQPKGGVALRVHPVKRLTPSR